MKTKKTAIIATFTALTISLNLSPLKIPAPYAPFLIYQVWEIPIVAAFLLYGFTVSILIAVANTLTLLAVFPGTLPVGPLYNLTAIVSMLFGLSIPRIIGKNPQKNEEEKSVKMLTILGIILRVGVMTIVNWIFLRFPPPVGFGLSNEVIIASLPSIAFFNATLALYTVPLGYFIAKTIRLHVKA